MRVAMSPGRDGSSRARSTARPLGDAETTSEMTSRVARALARRRPSLASPIAASNASNAPSRIFSTARNPTRRARRATRRRRTRPSPRHRARPRRARPRRGRPTRRTRGRRVDGDVTIPRGGTARILTCARTRRPSGAWCARRRQRAGLTWTRWTRRRERRRRRRERRRDGRERRRGGTAGRRRDGDDGGVDVAEGIGG